MRLPYFPIVPQNAPPDDLASYLELYSRAAVGMQPRVGPSHAEWDVNLPIPRMRALEGLRELRGFGAVGEPLGVDGASYDTPRVAPPYRLGDIRIVPAFWAQRAINAAYGALGQATRVVTDGVAGPQTLSAMKALRLRYIADLARAGVTGAVAMPTIVDRGHLSMDREMEVAMSRYNQVADVAARPATTAPAPTPEPDVVVAPESGGASGGIVLAVALGIGAAMWFGRRR